MTDDVKTATHEGSVAAMEATSRRRREEEPEPREERLPIRPLDTLHAFWLAGMSCDGCTIAVSGATNPPVEDLLNGTMPTMPKLLLHHPVLSVEAGEEFMRNFEMAEEGELDAPYVIIYEGSIADESIAAKTGGYWAGLGVEHLDDGTVRPIPTAEWLERLAPDAAAVIAIGTCATWGGVPSAAGNPTGAMSVMDLLGADYRSAFGLPVVNVPGCAPIGDNFTETVAAIVLFLQGIGPLPEFDELGRPAWLFEETVHRGCTRAGYYEEGVFTDEFGGKECLVEIGCWGPVVNCNIVERGAINHVGGCMQVGGACIGCTMPGFPDKFTPFYERPPGSSLSTGASRSVGAIVRRLRGLTNRDRNREKRWGSTGAVPSGWGHVPPQTPFEQVAEYFYDKLQHWGSVRPGREGKEPSRGWGGHPPSQK